MHDIAQPSPVRKELRSLLRGQRIPNGGFPSGRERVQEPNVVDVPAIVCGLWRSVFELALMTRVCLRGVGDFFTASPYVGRREPRLAF